MPNLLVDKFNHISGRPGFDYTKIDENVFLGTNMCCQFGFNKELLAKNVRADISLEDERIDTPLGVDYFIWLPTFDHEAPSPDKLSFGVEVLESLINKNIKIYIHCKNGHGRAPTLFIAYLIKKGMKPDEAINYLKSKRPVIHLSQNQIDALNTFSKTA
ncbi:MAG TPA: dual specificity protein phosphatase family protein [Patescibacteria group bacterium]